MSDEQQAKFIRGDRYVAPDGKDLGPVKATKAADADESDTDDKPASRTTKK